MKNLKVMLVAGFLAFSGAANAELSFGEAKEAWEAGGDAKLATQIYLGGMADGMVYANLAAEIKTGESLFCAPKKLAVTSQNLYSITVAFVEASDTIQADSSFGIAAVIAMRDAFPCA